VGKGVYFHLLGVGARSGKTVAGEEGRRLKAFGLLRRVRQGCFPLKLENWGYSEGFIVGYRV